MVHPQFCLYKFVYKSVWHKEKITSHAPFSLSRLITHMCKHLDLLVNGEYVYAEKKNIFFSYSFASLYEILHNESQYLLVYYDFFSFILKNDDISFLNAQIFLWHKLQTSHLVRFKIATVVNLIHTATLEMIIVRILFFCTAHGHHIDYNNFNFSGHNHVWHSGDRYVFV